MLLGVKEVEDMKEEEKEEKVEKDSGKEDGKRKGRKKGEKGGWREVGRCLLARSVVPICGITEWENFKGKEYKVVISILPLSTCLSICLSISLSITSSLLILSLP